MAVFRPELELGLVFSYEALDGIELSKPFRVLRDNLRFFDAPAVSANDTGIWAREYGATADYPILEAWQANAQDKDGWRSFPSPDSAQTFLAVSEQPGQQASTVLGSLLIEYVPDSDFEQLARDAYYGEVNTWQSAFYRRDEGGVSLIGGMFVTVKDGTAHTIWFEMPEADFDTVMPALYVTINGYALD